MKIFNSERGPIVVPDYAANQFEKYVCRIVWFTSIHKARILHENEVLCGMSQSHS